MDESEIWPTWGDEADALRAVAAATWSMADRIGEAAGNWSEAQKQWEQRSLEIAQTLSSLLVVIEKTGVGAEPVDREADTN